MDTAKQFDARFERILAATNSKGPSDLARILGIHPSSIGAAKKRQQIPTGWIERIAEEFGVRTDWLFFGEGEKASGKTGRTTDPSEIPTPSGCPRCAELEQELRLEREERRELARENRELLKQNGDLRVELERAKARAAPEEEPEGASSGKDAAA